jgi:hypothetical protein
VNNARRKTIAAAQAAVADAVTLLEGAITALTDARDEEQEFYDNMPESFQTGDRGQAAEAAVDALTEAIDAIEELTGNDIDGLLATAQE